MKPEIKKGRPDAPVAFSGLTITLGREILIKEIPAFQVKASVIEIVSIVDLSADKKIVAATNGPLGSITLWEGAAYDAIGQWTDNDVKNRILELYPN